MDIEEQGGQLPQELIDNIVDLLSSSPTDWRTCALVSGSWVNAAQAHIFREVAFHSEPRRSNERLWSRFHETLLASPHLIRHVRHLAVDPHMLSIDTFIVVCNFPFTHLNGLIIKNIILSRRTAIALQQLLSLPTFDLVDLGCQFTQPSDVLAIWEHGSPSIKHVALLYTKTSDDPILPARPRNNTSPVQLESLNIVHMGPEPTKNWLIHALSPFDLSRLKALSSNCHAEILHWARLAPSLRTIDALEFSPRTMPPMIDLALLPSLTVLRISSFEAGASPIAIQTLSTLAPSSQIRRIVLAGLVVSENDRFWTKLDSIVADLQMDPTPIVELEIHPIHANLILPHLSRLRARKIVNLYSNIFSVP
ncbi:hypothetical protein B0H17DRAFT_1197589 [Mycena rosella]|uniref:F-box domain-containing protein n=1 Tax=Mycena rosella TaxID=1033263 RepID=A0AAD7DTA1_MYCRO|nr:hypothetical protein B0H17DRAFT_1197589 [Mycena rosella]